MKIKEKGEKFAKKTRNEHGDNNNETNNGSKDNYDPVNTFGEIYAMSPDKFQFLRGERNFIKIIVAHVQKLVDNGGENKGLAQFKERKRKKTQKTNINHQFCIDNNAKENSADSKSTNCQSNNELYDKIINCLKSYEVDTNGYDVNMVHVDPSGAYGNIKCILCGDDSSKRVTYYQPGNRTAYWVLSNFTSHLEKKHKLVPARSKSTNKTNKKIKINADSSSTLKFNENRSDDSSNETHNFVPLNEISQHDSNCNLLGECVINLENENEDYSLEIVEVEIAQPNMQPSEISNSWLYSQIAEQVRKMIAAQLTHSECTEQMEFKFKNQDARIVYIIKIPGDGNCLFTSIAHQLWPTAVTSAECKENAKKIRATVVEHILANIKMYQMYIEDNLYQIKSLNNDDASIETKCKMWVRHVLSRQGNWAGIESIKAVSHIYRVNVVTFHECGTVTMVQAAKQHFDRTIILAYRFYLKDDERIYNHYDSICDMDSDTILTASEFIMNK